jgi:putative hydrolase of the HAD superfamily
MSGDIQLVTFDLDNTLWDVDSVIRQAEAELKRWLGERVPEYGPRFQGEELARVRALVLEEQPALVHDVSALRLTVLDRAFTLLGFGAGESRRLARDAFDVFYEARQRVVFYESALETLEQLAGAFRLGALTNGNADVERIGLSRFFSFALSSADVGARKPAPDIFHAALGRCGVQANETVHIGDNLVDDIQGAGSLGIHTIWTNHAGAEAPADAHPPTVTVQHLSELPDAITRIRGR